MSNDIGANALSRWMQWVLGFIIGGMFVLGTFTFNAYAHADTVAKQEAADTQKDLDEFKRDVKSMLQVQTVLLQKLVTDVAVITAKMEDQ